MDISTKIRTAPRARSQFIQLPDVIGLGGAISGLGAGIVMAMVAAIIAVFRGDDIWLEAKQIAAPLFPGFDPMSAGFAPGPIVVGTLVHLFVAVALGATFSIIKRRILHLPSDMGVPVLAGLIYGFLVWSIAFFIVLPIVNPALLDMYQPAFIIQHLIYGVVLGLIYAVVRPSPYTEYARQQMYLRRREHE